MKSRKIHHLSPFTEVAGKGREAFRPEREYSESKYVMSQKMIMNKFNLVLLVRSIEHNDNVDSFFHISTRPTAWKLRSALMPRSAHRVQ
jgi:hypothetical protein